MAKFDKGVLDKIMCNMATATRNRSGFPQDSGIIAPCGATSSDLYRNEVNFRSAFIIELRKYYDGNAATSINEMNIDSEYPYYDINPAYFTTRDCLDMLVTIDGESYAFEFKFRGCKNNTSLTARKEAFIRDICRLEQIGGTSSAAPNANDSSCLIPNILTRYAVFLTNIEDFWKKDPFTGSNVKPGVKYFDAGKFAVPTGSSGGSRKVNKSAVPFNTARQQQGEWFMFIDDNGEQVGKYQYAVVEVI